MTQCCWSYQKISKQLANIIKNERKKQQKLKARLDEAEERAWQAERKFETTTAAKVELELKNGRLKKCLRVAKNPTSMTFSVST